MRGRAPSIDRRRPLAPFYFDGLIRDALGARAAEAEHDVDVHQGESSIEDLLPRQTASLYRFLHVLAGFPEVLFFISDGVKNLLGLAALEGGQAGKIQLADRGPGFGVPPRVDVCDRDVERRKGLGVAGAVCRGDPVQEAGSADPAISAMSLSLWPTRVVRTNESAHIPDRRGSFDSHRRSRLFIGPQAAYVFRGTRCTVPRHDEPVLCALTDGSVGRKVRSRRLVATGREGAAGEPQAKENDERSHDRTPLSAPSIERATVARRSWLAWCGSSELPE
jgi:hypothetical protein